MFKNWWRKRDDSRQAYERNEPKDFQVFYKAYARFYAETPEDIKRLVATVADITGLPPHQESYPADAAAIRSACDALRRAARECYKFELNVENEDPTQMDRLADHLVDPALRPFFQDGKVRNNMSATEMESYYRARESISVPNEPLLYFAMGAFQCEWLVHHRRATLCLYPPIRPIQSFPDMISAGHTVCLHPFSQVNKRLSDPEGDNLEYKNSRGIAARYIPPFPLIASLADAEFAAMQLLPAVARDAVHADKANDVRTAFRLYCQIINESTDNTHLLSMAAACAFKAQEYNAAARWMEKLLAIQPDLIMIIHNLAILYGGVPDRRPEAIGMLRRAITIDPYYGRGRITLASFLLEDGKRGEAVAQAQWVVEHDLQLKDEATRFLRDLGSA